MEGSPNDSIKLEPGKLRGYEPNGPSFEEPVRLTPEEYAMVVNFKNQKQGVTSGAHPSQVPLPTPVHSTSAGSQSVSVPSAPGYQTVTIPDALAHPPRDANALKPRTSRTSTRSRQRWTYSRTKSHV